MTSQPIQTKNKLDKGLTFKISRFKEKIKKTQPHKHDEYYELIFLSKGKGFHFIETEKYLVSPPEFYFLKPRQLHCWQFTSIPRGYVILFQDAHFDAVRENELVELYRQLGRFTRVSLSKGEYPEYLLNEILYEHNENKDHSRQIIHGLLKALFGKMLRLSYITSFDPDLYDSHFERFQKLLVAECSRLHKVKDYATRLNITPQNLNTVCKKQANVCASELIAQQIMLEAKRYILHTDHTIDEISYMLSFTDPSNFTKFFKKAEGLTPVQYRNQSFQ